MIEMKPAAYSRPQIWLHWVMAVLILMQFVLHEQIVAAWEALEKGLAPDINLAVRSHVIGGGLVLLLVIWRLVLRVRRGAPALPAREHPALKGLAHLTHWSLYALMVILPVTGLATWFGGNETADFIHTTLKFPLIAFVVLHIAGALYQQFVLRTGLISRMTRPG
ncbi:cytochrome b [Hoeflea ulvae]|uniref:Cytochrome b/b6 domain-containing protein n=1 Tax=Hoeflea ulvae TaxID=2983764 RepID=A0ABT3YB99_9HYPH|nr:cytochrome b/b6 domain-containing protein [Hoeflea ulvae]MCY0093159.1 cytochrome b/b6 domain-containing protein [Hoeflea ulvae]